MKIKYVKGDATNPYIIPNYYSVICHCCNALGAWGRGFVVPLGARFPKAKDKYRELIKTTSKDERLGKVSFAKVTKDIVVANIIGQYGIYSKDNKPLVNYDAIRQGFETVIKNFKTHNMQFTIHMPKIGCGLAKGDWNVIENIIKDTFLKEKIDVYVYLL